MKRTKLKDRLLPDYTKGEEIFNMVSHIVGGAFGIIALTFCVIKAFLVGDPYKIVGAFIFGFSMIALYTMSSVYHGLKSGMAKKVMQVIDHCTIFILISGTYTPIALGFLRKENAVLGWVIFGVVWGVSVLGIVLNAIDLKKYSLFSIICYVTLGWCIVLPGKFALSVIPKPALTLLLIGGGFYTLGAVIFCIAAKKTRCYLHSVFHILVVLGSVFHFLAILLHMI